MKLNVKIYKMIVLVIVFSLLLVTGASCKKDNSEKGNSEENFKECYTLLKSSSESVQKIAEDIQSGWYYAIYKFDDSDSFGNHIDLAKSTYLTSTEILKAANRYYNSIKGTNLPDDNTLVTLYFDDFNLVVNSIIKAYEDKETFKNIEDDLNKVKSKLHDLSTSDTKYNDTKALYDAVSSFVNYCKNPTGNYNSNATTMQDYKNKINNLLSALEFYY